MMRQASLPLAVLLLLAPGCDSKDSTAKTTQAKAGDAKADENKGAETKADEPEAATAEAGEPDDDKPAAKAETKIPQIDDAKLAKFRKNAEALQTELATARKAAKDEDWKAAVAAYDKAVELDDDNPVVLGELGWAHFEAGDMKAAEHNVRLALRYEQQTKRRASLLYKLGRIEEQRGDFALAKKHYDHSLALEDSDEAREHNDAIGDKAAAACTDGKCTKPDYETLDDACKAMVARVHEQLGLTAETAADEFKCDPAAAQKVALEGGDASEAVILQVVGKHAEVGEEEYDLLAHIDGGWHWVGTLLDIENPHHGGISRTGGIKSIEAKELVPDSPGQEVLVHLEFGETDIDFADNLIYHDEHEAYVVCGMSEGKHICHEIPLYYYYEAAALDSSVETEHDLSVHEFSVKAEFDGKGNVTLAGEGEVPEAMAGTKVITELTEPQGFVFLHDD